MLPFKVKLKGGKYSTIDGLFADHLGDWEGAALSFLTLNQGTLGPGDEIRVKTRPGYCVRFTVGRDKRSVHRRLCPVEDT